MKEPLVSVIVPVYKVPEKFLRKCIESLIGQTLENIEILLVDDGSPDDCGKICDEYANKNENIKVIHKENGGLSAARNTGCENAHGKWMMFVDGDDWVERYIRVRNVSGCNSNYLYIMQMLLLLMQN